MPPKTTDPRKVKYFEDRAEFVLRNPNLNEISDFVLQTFHELSKDGWSVCTNGRVAANIEKMLPFASAEATAILLKAFTKDMEPLFNTKFAHHVLHAALRHCVNIPELRHDELIASCIDDYLEFMWDTYGTFVQHEHASPALRVYLQLMSGVSIPKSPHSGMFELDKVTLTDPLDSEKYVDRITILTNQFLLSEAFNSLVIDPMSGAFLQALIIICSKRLEDSFDAICSNIFRKSKLLVADSDSEVVKLGGGLDYRLPMGFSHSVAVCFLETQIGLLSGRFLRKFMQEHLLLTNSDPQNGQGSLVCALASHPNACRVLRAVIRAAKRASDLDILMTALQAPAGHGAKSGLEAALVSGQHYLLVALAEACKKCSGNQADKVQATCEKMIVEAFGFPAKVKKPDDQLINAVVKLKRKVDLEIPERDEERGGGEEDADDASSEKSEVEVEKGAGKEVKGDEGSATECNLAGCLVAEAVLGFGSHRPTRLAGSLCALSPAVTVAWARNRMLHRVLEQAILSPSVPAQRKLHIFASLKPQLATVAMDQSGSRVVEALWRAAEASASAHQQRKPKSGSDELSGLREELARSLAPSAERLNAAKFGRFVERLVGSAAYKTNPQRWRSVKLGQTETVNERNAKRPHPNGPQRPEKRRKK